MTGRTALPQQSTSDHGSGAMLQVVRWADHWRLGRCVTVICKDWRDLAADALRRRPRGISDARVDRAGPFGSEGTRIFHPVL
jgi:hypothetical protein